jgi:hypothetical protein
MTVSDLHLHRDAGDGVGDGDGDELIPSKSSLQKEEKGSKPNPLSKFPLPNTGGRLISRVDPLLFLVSG